MQKAQTAADEASPETIATAQGQVTTAENAAKEAKSAVETAQSAEKTAKDAADKQQAVVNTIKLMSMQKLLKWLMLKNQ